MKMYSINVLANFLYSGRYQWSSYPIWVMASSPEAAMRMLVDNERTLFKIFQNKRTSYGKRWLRLSEKKKLEFEGNIKMCDLQPGEVFNGEGVEYITKEILEERYPEYMV